MSKYKHRHANLDRRSEAVHVVASIALVAQKHLLTVSLATTNSTLGVQDRSGPRDAALQRAEMEKDLKRTQILKYYPITANALHNKRVCENQVAYYIRVNYPTMK